MAFHQSQQSATQHMITNHPCELDGDYDLTADQLTAMLGAGPAARDRSDPSYERPLRVDPKRIAQPPQR